MFVYIHAWFDATLSYKVDPLFLLQKLPLKRSDLLKEAENPDLQSGDLQSGDLSPETSEGEGSECSKM